MGNNNNKTNFKSSFFHYCIPFLNTEEEIAYSMSKKQLTVNIEQPINTNKIDYYDDCFMYESKKNKIMNIMRI
jgi:hypothetical protein